MGYGYDIPQEQRNTFSKACKINHHPDCKSIYKVKATGKPCACFCHEEKT